MKISEDFLAKIDKDFQEYLKKVYPDHPFAGEAFKAGYLACLRRFGGNGFLPKNPKSAYYNNGD